MITNLLVYKFMDTNYKRLESLDVLRGFDLFCLVALCGILHSLRPVIATSWYDSFACGVGGVFSLGFGYAAFHVHGRCFDAVFVIAL